MARKPRSPHLTSYARQLIAKRDLPLKSPDNTLAAYDPRQYFQPRDPEEIEAEEREELNRFRDEPEAWFYLGFEQAEEERDGVMHLMEEDLLPEYPTGFKPHHFPEEYHYRPYIQRWLKPTLISIHPGEILD